MIREDEERERRRGGEGEGDLAIEDRVSSSRARRREDRGWADTELGVTADWTGGPGY